MTKISILHPSRSRVQKSLQTTSKWIANAGVDVELIVSIDDNDPQLQEYIKAYPSVLISPNRSAVDAINNAAKAATGDILIVVSDDSDCPRNWGQRIIEATRNRTDWIMKVNDGIQRWIITMPIMDRVYYKRFGYIYYESYKHLFCDTEITHVADLLKRKITRDDLSFPHRHYSVTREKKDEVTIKADSTWEQGKQLYLKRVRESFGLSGVDVMRISDLNHKRWLEKNLK